MTTSIYNIYVYLNFCQPLGAGIEIKKLYRRNDRADVQVPARPPSCTPCGPLASHSPWRRPAVAVTWPDVGAPRVTSARHHRHHPTTSGITWTTSTTRREVGELLLLLRREAQSRMQTGGGADAEPMWDTAQSSPRCFWTPKSRARTRVRWRWWIYTTTEPAAGWDWDEAM